MKTSARAGANRIVPSRFQVPPSPAGASQTRCAAPPRASMVFNAPSAKNPRKRLSADQNGKAAPSVPGSGVSLEPVQWTHPEANRLGPDLREKRDLPAVR